jgi:hypothetical protein
MAEATCRVDMLIRTGIFDENVTQRTEELARAAAEERAVSRRANREAELILSTTQRQKLAAWRASLVD